MADDLATTLLLATDKPVVIAPAMNVRMWLHAATQANIAALKARGVQVIEPVEGEMACGEYGPGRLARADGDYAVPGSRIFHASCEGGRSRSRVRRRAPRAALNAAATSLGSGRTLVWLENTSSSPPARPMSRSTRCGSSPTARQRQTGLRHRRRRRPGRCPRHPHCRTSLAAHPRRSRADRCRDRRADDGSG